MLITIITLFPQIFEPVFSVSILKRARAEKKLDIKLLNLRDFGIGKHKTVDDKLYGGGVGMVLRVDVLDRAIEAAKKAYKKEGKTKAKQAVILLDPKGTPYHQKIAESFVKFDHLILIAGRYEGFDERIRKLADYEISVGDYVLSGGEIPAMIIVDSIARLIPGVLKKREASSIESFTGIGGERILEYPQYTRPPKYKNKSVPKVLLSGNFKLIEGYRLSQAKETTKKRRPDLLKI